MLSTYSGNLLLDWLLTTGSATRPTTWFAALHVGDPGLVGDNELLVATDADYVRKAVTFGAAASKANASTTAETWTADVAATTYIVTHVGIWTASTAGNFVMHGELAVPETVVAGGAFVLDIGRVIGALT